MELANLNGVWRQLESSSVEVNATRNRFVRSASEKGSASSDYIVEPNYKNPYSSGGRNESQQRLMLLRSSFVLYILVLHILVFIKISFCFAGIEPQASFAGKGNRTLTLLEKKLTPSCHQSKKEMSEDGRRQRRWR
ncbi:hypothetical protein G4B88_023259 [Cannabis sativa]|uniref:Uncharacterized protein n=1 Tax=Cannabis sativa TaxID=3483 RepID=A0A7J6HZ87_CANSA|nr:hypothetical protein G4B88_023259 [Cannabis sativa]